MTIRSISFLIPATLFILGIFIPQAVFAQNLTPTQAVVLTVLPVTSTPEPETFSVNGISSPKPDDVIFGSIQIIGTSSAAWDLAFSSISVSSADWFLLAKSDQQVLNGLLAVWDTQSVPDGMYSLRLRVFQADIQQELVVKVNIRNSTPNPTQGTIPLDASQTPTIQRPESLSEIILTETPIGFSPTTPPSLSPISGTQHQFLKNRASLDPKDILIYLGESVLAVFVVFLVAGLMFFLRRK